MMITGQARESHKRYWLASSLMQMRIEPKAVYDFDEVPVPWRRDELGALNDFAAKEKVDVIDCLMAGWALLLCRYADGDETDVSVAGEENHEDCASMMARLAAVRPVSVLVGEVDSYRVLARQVRDKRLAGGDPGKDATAPPRFDVALRIDADDPSSTRVLTRKGAFEERFAGRLANRIALLIEGCLANPDNDARSIPIATEEELRLVLREWNRTQVPFAEEMTLHGCIEEQVARTPDNVAVVSKEETLTYRDLNERANRLAHAIRAHYRTVHGSEILPDTLIGLCMNRGAGMIVAMLGILKAGCAYVPLDPSYPAERLRFIMDDAQAPLVVTEMAVLEKLLFLNESDYGVISLDGGWSYMARQPGENPVPIAGPTNLAYVIYTSGSTGRPKGSMVEHRSVVNFAAHERRFRHMTPDRRVLQFASINFDAAVLEIYPALFSGASLYIAQGDMRQDPEMLHRILVDQSITDTFAPPAFLARMPRERVPSLRTLVVGGDVCDAETLEYWGSATELINVYGPTECTVLATECVVTEGRLPNEIGGPLANTTLYVLDRRRNLVPPGVVGELYIGGVGVSRGYLRRSELTRERFIENPFATAEDRESRRNTRLYKTGDRVRWLPGGTLEFLGRVDFQVKIRGYRVEPGEIEAVLGTHGEIRECAVVPYEDGKDKRLAAFYVPIPKRSPEIASLRSHLAEVLPDYMIPSVFVEMAELPLSPSGKVNRSMLSPPKEVLVRLRQEPAATYCPPETAEEEEIARILCVMLNAERIGVRTDLFDLGVHSLMAARIASEIRKRFSIELGLKDVFENPSIQKLGCLVAERAKLRSTRSVSIPTGQRDRSTRIPLTYQQEQIWFLSRLVPNNRAYNSQFAVRFVGKLNSEVLTQSINEIIRRHEILQTTFHESPDGPIQVVHGPWKADIPEVDLRAVPEADREAALERLVQEELSRPFDFTRLPLIRWFLFRLGDEESIFLEVEHHFVHDGWEVAIFLGELKALYSACLEGRESPLPDLPVQYADFALWQRQHLDGERLDCKVDYWVSRVKEFDHVLNLCTDRPRPPVQRFNGDAVRFNLDRRLYHALREFSKKRKVTLFATMYSAFAVLVSKYSGQKRLLIGTGVANRTPQETEKLLGMFVNTVLLTADLSANPSFEELVRATKENMLHDAEHYDTPFSRIVERLKLGIGTGRNPLFQVLFAFHDSAVPRLELPNLRGTIIEKHNATAKMDLNVIVIPRAEQHLADRGASAEEEDLTVLWEYNSDLFDRTTMSRMAGHYTNLLEQVLAGPERSVEDLEVLSNEERSRILDDFNSDKVEYERNRTLNSLFLEQVRKNPGKAAVVHGAASVTFAELDARAVRLARAITKTHGPDFEQGTPIGLCVDRGIDMVVGMLAILKAGGAYVPLPPYYPESRLDFMLDDAGVTTVLAQRSWSSRIPALAADGRNVILLDDSDGGVAEVDAGEWADPCSPEQTAYIIYTSGSTGKPKGVCISHRAVHNYLLSIFREAVTDQDVVPQMATYAFDASVFEIWGAILCGATLAIVDSDTVMDPSKLKRALESHGVTSALFTTALLNAIVEHDLTMLTRLRTVMFGGEAANLDAVRRLLEARPDSLKVFHCYGPTECTVYSTWCELMNGRGRLDSVPIGRPLTNYTSYVLDDSKRPVPIGVAGELYVGGESIATGYLKRPQLTKERFLDNPFATESERASGRNLRLYRTGDVVRWRPDGHLEFLGRTDFQVKIRGFRIEVEEIESVLSRQGVVKQCVVVPWEQHLVAYWVPKDPSSSVTQEELKSLLLAHLPDYMVPSVFVRMAEFQLTTNLKIDRNKLPPPSLGDVRAFRRQFIAPRTRTEEALAGIWMELLKLDKVSVNDSFFEVGGTSILTVLMLSHIKRRLGADVNMAQMFARPTIEAIAAHIDGTEMAAGSLQDNLSIAIRDAKMSVDLGAVQSVPPGKATAVLLTGATGFLGVHLLNSLIAMTGAEVFCLIRGHDSGDVSRRLDKNLEAYGLGHLKGNPRVRLIRGDLDVPGLGLDGAVRAELIERLDGIYHCGAFVHHLYDYGTLKRANVESTIDLLRLAGAGKGKVFNFISTAGTATVRNEEGEIIEVQTGDTPVSSNGYTLSKWVAERILTRAAQAGLDVNIFRPGNIMGDTVKGACPPEKNHALLVLKGCIQMGFAPDLRRSVEMMPVDTLAEAVVRLSLESRGFNIYNMNNPLQMTWRQWVSLVASNGFDLQIVPLTNWRDHHLGKIDERNAMFPLKEAYLKDRKDLLPGVTMPFTGWNSRQTQAKLDMLGVHYPTDYEGYAGTILGYLAECGFLERSSGALTGKEAAYD